MNEFFKSKTAWIWIALIAMGVFSGTYWIKQSKKNIENIPPAVTLPIETAPITAPVETEDTAKTDEEKLEKCREFVKNYDKNRWKERVHGNPERSIKIESRYSICKKKLGL